MLQFCSLIPGADGRSIISRCRLSASSTQFINATTRPTAAAAASNSIRRRCAALRCCAAADRRSVAATAEISGIPGGMRGRCGCCLRRLITAFDQLRSTDDANGMAAHTRDYNTTWISFPFLFPSFSLCLPLSLSLSLCPVNLFIVPLTSPRASVARWRRARCSLSRAAKRKTVPPTASRDAVPRVTSS